MLYSANVREAAQCPLLTPSQKQARMQEMSTVPPCGSPLYKRTAWWNSGPCDESLDSTHLLRRMWFVCNHSKARRKLSSKTRHIASSVFSLSAHSKCPITEKYCILSQIQYVLNLAFLSIPWPKIMALGNRNVERFIATILKPSEWLTRMWMWTAINGENNHTSINIASQCTEVWLATGMYRYTETLLPH